MLLDVGKEPTKITNVISENINLQGELDKALQMVQPLIGNVQKALELLSKNDLQPNKPLSNPKLPPMLTESLSNLSALMLELSDKSAKVGKENDLIRDEY